MKSICKKIQSTLAESGPSALQGDRAAQDHIAECSDCFAALESQSALDASLRALPDVDAPDDLVAALLKRPELSDKPETPQSIPATTLAGRWRAAIAAIVDAMRPRTFAWGGSAVAVLVLVVLVNLNLSKSLQAPSDVLDQKEEARKTGDDAFDAADQNNRARSEGGLVADQAAAAPSEAPRYEYYSPLKDGPTEPQPDLVASQRQSQDNDATSMEAISVTGSRITRSDAIDPSPADDEVDQSRSNRSAPDSSAQAGAGGPVAGAHSGLAAAPASSVPPPPAVEPVFLEPPPPTPPAPPAPARAPAVLAPEPITITDSLSKQEIVAGKAIELAASPPEVAEVIVDTELSTERPLGFSESNAKWVDGADVNGRFRRVDSEIAGSAKEDRFGQDKGRIAPSYSEATPQPAPLTDPARAAAAAFLAERERVQGHSFKPASGYWSNTYLPGDPAMRLLQAKLADASVQIHEQSRPSVQPFDPPADSALAVYLHADRRGLNAPGRMLLQVGLQGSLRQGGRRPAMNMAVVLDLRGEISTQTAITLRALLDALNQAAEPGDRFRVIVAGRPGGSVIEPKDFRHGVLRVTLDRLLGAADDAASADRRGERAVATATATSPAPAPATLSLPQAMATAMADTLANDDPASSLGSSTVLLFTAQALGEAAQPLADLAHRSAVAGIPVSVVGIGPNLDLGSLDALALAGQGTRRLLDNPAQAAALIGRELSTSSRVVARAVRLRIRLAPGVQLIDVIGSERLDEARAQRVRDAEQSIDQRLSRNLGIEADRGKDEEGIQIVIPSFYASDSHVVLLDVLAPGAGAIADVTVRYKDLVQLRNGVNRASLSMGDEPRAAGPLEQNVLKNLLSRRLSEALDQAGHALTADDVPKARDLLEQQRMLLTGLRLILPGLDTDPDLSGDLAMLSAYAQLLGQAIADIALAPLSQSLRYAALLKILPRPLEIRS